jgi:hypothetical protein
MGVNLLSKLNFLHVFLIVIGIFLSQNLKRCHIVSLQLYSPQLKFPLDWCYFVKHFIDNVIWWAADWTIGVLGIYSRWGLEIFLFITASRTALGPTQPPIQWVPGALSLGVKRPGREADHSPPSSAEVKNAWSYTSTPKYVFMAWCLVKHRDNFTFTFYLVCVCSLPSYAE